MEMVSERRSPKDEPEGEYPYTDLHRGQRDGGTCVKCFDSLFKKRISCPAKFVVEVIRLELVVDRQDTSRRRKAERSIIDPGLTSSWGHPVDFGHLDILAPNGPFEDDRLAVPQLISRLDSPAHVPVPFEQQGAGEGFGRFVRYWRFTQTNFRAGLFVVNDCSVGNGLDAIVIREIERQCG